MATQYEKRKQKEEFSPTGRSYDLIKDEDSRKYIKVTIEYNIKTGEAKVVKSEAISDSMEVALYKIKELFTKKLMGLKYD